MVVGMGEILMGIGWNCRGMGIGIGWVWRSVDLIQWLYTVLSSRFEDNKNVLQVTISYLFLDLGKELVLRKPNEIGYLGI